MKTYNERTQSIMEKAEKRKAENRRTKRWIAATCCSLAFILILSALPFVPWNQLQKNPSEPDYSNHEYAKLISALKPFATEDKGSHDDIEMPDLMLPEGVPSTDVAGKYEEITDNQVDGVIESDLIKRSDQYIFYLRSDVLSVYSIAGDASREVGVYPFTDTPQVSYTYYANRQMYLSEDCKTITIITGCYFTENSTANVAVINLDVSDPANIIQSSVQYMSGSYLSSRMVDGQLYLMTHYFVPRCPDFQDETTYVPQYGLPGEMESVKMQDICIPDKPNSAMYTVVYRMDGKDLSVKATSALLSYAGEIYMSKENIFLTRGYTDVQEKNGATYRQFMTEITRLNVALDVVSTYQVAGEINNQFNLDEYGGILRIVTTTGGSIVHESTNGETVSAYIDTIPSNANLSCISLETGEMVASVENFAPEGESVQSVRFDGDKAYVCTSLVLQDPVFFFDLSDINNITYKDTGTIPGYSMSLVDFADGFLMGVGYGDDFGNMKIEIYREGTASIESHCKYERNCGFSDDYKAYYIDRENRFIGLGIRDYENHTERYLLLFFDGYNLIPVVDEEFDGVAAFKRSVYIDGYLYMFGDSFYVKAI